MKFWQVDAFASKPFKGNPAAVVVLEKALDESLMQSIALEMNLSETAYVELREGKNPYLRWFTISDEIDLCGHATIASAHILFSKFYTNENKITFDTKYYGPLTVLKEENFYTLIFPLHEIKKIPLEEIHDIVVTSLNGAEPVEAYDNKSLMLVFDSEETIYNLKLNTSNLAKYKKGIIFTAPSKGKYDFISRFFSYHDGCAEDPVTGSAHCILAPFWAKKLNKTQMLAYQASKRGGELRLTIVDNDVKISGEAITVIEGHLEDIVMK